MTDTARWALPLLEAGQAQKEMTHNEALQRLDLLAQRTRRLMVFQTLSLPGETVYPDTEDHPITEREPLLDAGWPKMAFIEHRFSNDPTNWWVPNHAGIEAMLRSSGLRVTSRPAGEIYLCVPDHANAAWQWDTQYQSVFPAGKAGAPAAATDRAELQQAAEAST